MKKNIVEKLNRLGGNTERVHEDKTFVENWQSIRFDHYLYDKDWDVYGIDEFYKAHENLYHTDKEKFYHHLMEHYFSEHDIPYGQYFFKDWMFMPFKVNSEDHGELDGFVDEDEIKKVVKGTEMDFICIFYSYGYPDHYFVCTTDQDQINPTVYGTDHETYFEEIDNAGSLEDFLDRFMTQEEFLEVVKNYVIEKFGE